jgi:GT2 family glycosyltransferase
MTEKDGRTPMDANRLVSVVLPTRDRVEAIRATLESLSEQTFRSNRFRVIVVDQSSTPDTADLVGSLSTPYELVWLAQGPLGIAAARNLGASAANTDLVVFLDGDLIAHPELIAAHVRYHRTWDRALVAGRILPYQPIYTSFLDRCANPEAGLDRGPHDGQLPFYQAFGGNLSIPKDIFMELGGFDERFWGAEDTDLAYRAVQRGCKIINGPKAIAHHNHPRTLDERCIQYHSYSPMIPLLLNKHPELRGKIPGLRELELVNWKEDTPSLILAKLRLGFFGLRIVRAPLQAVLERLIKDEKYPRITKALYWRLIAGCNAAGFREGLRRYGWHHHANE